MRKFLLDVEIYEKARLNNENVFPVTIERKFYVINNIKTSSQAKKKAENYIKNIVEKNLPDNLQARIKKVVALDQLPHI